MVTVDFLKAAMASGAALPVNRRGHNGDHGFVNMTSGTTHVQPMNKIVYTKRDGIDILNSCIYYAKTRFKLDVTKDVPLTDDQLKAVMDRFAILMVMHEWVELWHVYGYDIDPRGSDMASSASDMAVYNPVFSKNITEQLEAVWAHINDDGNARDAEDFFSEKKFVIMAFLANCLSRDLDDGHNWRTTGDNTCIMTVMKSFKNCQTELQAFMARESQGHDLWHFVPDVAMYAIVKEMTNPTGTVLEASYIYSGRDVKGLTLRVGCGLGDTLLTRSYRNSGMGGPLVTLDWLLATLNAVSVKMSVANMEVLVGHIEQLKISLTANPLDSKARGAIKTALAPIASFAYGYLGINPVTASAMQDKLSAFKMAGRSDHMISQGGTLAREMAKFTTTAASMVTAMAAMLASVQAGLNAVLTALGKANMGDLGIVVMIDKSNEELTLDANKARLDIEIMKAQTEAAKVGVSSSIE